MKKMLILLSLIFALPLSAQDDGCNIVINVDNSNCNDNTLVGGSSKCPDTSCLHGDSCSTCDCMEVSFNSTFEYEGFAMGQEVTILPFVTGACGGTLFGNSLILTEASTSGMVNQCLRTDLCCDAKYFVGYMITITGTPAFTSATQTNNDSICFCGQRCELPSVTEDVLLFGGDFSASVLIACVKCKPKDCKCCN